MTEISDPLENSPEQAEQHPLYQLVGLTNECTGGGRATCEVRAAAGETAPSSFALTTAVDVLVVQAARTTVTPQEELNGTAELNVTYTRPAVGTVQVEAHEVGRVTTMRVLEFTVSDADGTLAFGRSTYAVRARSRR
jgi:acyl-coenzyme A thioesterase PaaI-like protein